MEYTFIMDESFFLDYYLKNHLTPAVGLSHLFSCTSNERQFYRRLIYFPNVKKSLLPIFIKNSVYHRGNER